MPSLRDRMVTPSLGAGSGQTPPQSPIGDQPIHYGMGQDRAVPKHPLEHHPGYATRYDMWTGQPYRVPVGTPRNREDFETLKRYDDHAYNSAMTDYSEAGKDVGGFAFDPDTGHRMKLGELQDVLRARYPQQVSNDWDVGGNMPQLAPADPALARTAQHIGGGGPLPPPRATPSLGKHLLP
jgi:hypothetical protein